MNHIKAFALVKWQTSEKLEVIEADGETLITQSLNEILVILKTKQISQFQKMYVQHYFRDSLPSKMGRWYYLPYNKEILQIVLASTECNQSNIEMLISTIYSKILNGNIILNDQKRASIAKLLQYFGKQYNKDPKQIKQIMQVLDNTKQSVQENIEKLINNKDQLSQIESKIPKYQVKSLELEDNSKIFYDTATAVHRKNRLNRLKKKLLLGGIMVLSAGFICYWFFY